MKVYVATRTSRKEEVREIYKKLIEMGHEITEDWTKHKSIKPYIKNQKMASKYAVEDINGVLDADVFILLCDEGGTGMFVEMGTAITMNLISKKTKVYVVGKYNDRSIFFFHPSVIRKDTIEEVLEELD